LIVFNFLWCRSETLDNLFNTQVCFNGGNPNLFKVRDDVTLKELTDQLDEINQRLNHIDTSRVEYVWYERPSFDSDGRLSFSRPELTNDDMRSMFSIFGQHSMFPRIEMDATLLRLHEDILKSLIQPDEHV